jgi:predicted dinucleotide-binding enzyme
MKACGSRGFRRRDVLKVAAGAVVALSPLLARMVLAADTKIKIGVIGSGHVGSAIGKVWASAGHPVMFASRDLDHDKQLAAGIGAAARAGTPAQAVAFGDVLLFAVPYGALPELGKALGSALKGKIIIDACNPFPNRDGAIANRARDEGVGKVSSELLPGARIVRAFNAIGAADMGAAHEQPGKIGMPIAGDDKQAIEIASGLISEIGYVPVLVGGLDKGRYLMPGTPLSGEHSPEEIRKIVAALS